MDPWYKITTPRQEVREGRSFNPDEFAVALEQVIAGTSGVGRARDRKEKSKSPNRTWSADFADRGEKSKRPCLMVAAGRRPALLAGCHQRHRALVVLPVGF
jgi:hypothetical protein